MSAVPLADLAAALKAAAEEADIASRTGDTSSLVPAAVAAATAYAVFAGTPAVQAAQQAAVAAYLATPEGQAAIAAAMS